MPSPLVQTSVALVLRKDKVRADGTAPVFLRATSARKSRYKATGVRVEPCHWNPRTSKVKGSHVTAAALNAKLGAILHEAKGHALGSKSAEAVQSAIGSGGSFSAFALRFIGDLKAKGQFWEERKYRTTYTKLCEALGTTDLTWDDLSVVALKRYERYLVVRKKNQPNTVRKELARLNRIVRQAVYEGEVEANDNPFARYRPPAGAPVNRRKLSEDEIKSILALGVDHGVSEDTVEALARDAFVFAFYAGGTRFSDVACLKESSVTSGRIHFETLKTKTAVSVPLPEVALDIAAKYAPGARSRGGFLFPMLADGDDRDGVHLRRRISSWNARINVALKRLAPRAELDPDGLSFHIARHSFADHARRRGGTMYGIGKTMGHHRLQTTEVYVRSFDQDAVDELAGSIW